MLWPFLHKKLRDRIPVMLLLVLQSEGSSPGRQGFKMGVSADSDLLGSIGGGIMEHKLVEKALALLARHHPGVSTMWQHHNKTQPSDRSGMICSGSQRIVFVPLTPLHLPLLEMILENRTPLWLKISESGFSLANDGPEEIELTENDEGRWEYIERLQRQPVAHIFGAGHVGLALSEILHFLGFYVKIYDDRERLNTLEQNQFADEKHVVAYDRIDDFLQSHPADYAIIMTIGYRNDQLLLRQLTKRAWKYVGMLGSAAKIETLKAEMADEGFDPALWEHISAPIGLPISSKTPQEIAVSIAAEIVWVKNGKKSYEL